ncbi:MAG: HIRAN domain-containing protein [Desulfuromonadales bacterium]
MSTQISVIDPKILAIIKASFEGGLSLPFVKEIFLMECPIAGTSHLNLIEVEPLLIAGDPLIFRREADNKYDSLAILIQDEGGRKLGYVPKDKNEVPARLMDAGKLLFGRLESKEWQSNWLKLKIRVFMRDM